MVAKSIIGGYSEEMITDFFQDVNDLRSMLIDVEYNSLPGLKLFALYLDFFVCTADAWKLRLYTKFKFPHATIRTERPEMVVASNHLVRGLGYLG